MAYFTILLAVVFTSLGQVMQKIVADRHLQNQPSKSTLLFVLFKKESIIAILCLLAGMLCWLATLRDMEVSKAFPFLSSGFIVVMLAAKFMMKESIPWHRWLGVILICLGLSLIAQS